MKVPSIDIIQNMKTSPIWLRWFNDISRSVDEIRTRGWHIHTGDTNITQHHFGRVNIFNIGASNAIAYLPSVDSSDLYSWVRFVRIGTGQLTVRAADSDRIEYSSSPGRIWCNEEKRLAANLELMLVDDDLWAILAGTGIWKVS